MRPLGDSALETLDRATVLDGPGRLLGAAVGTAAPDGSARRELLAGTWLGHPLHPLLTDVVIGAWTSAAVLDLAGDGFEDAADLLVALGVAAAVPTAASGLVDWGDTTGPARRVGLVHAAGNTTALGLYAASLVARRAGARTRGRVLAGLGGAVASVSGWLGGHLAYRLGVGVDRTTFDPPVEAWHDASMGVDGIADGEVRRVDVAGTPVALARSAGGALSAIHDRCSHRGCSLAEGSLRDGTLVCPCHGSAFALDGTVVRGPATAPQPAFDVRVVDGRVQLRSRVPG